MTNDKPLIVVLSRNYTNGIGVIRSLGAVGYTIDLVYSSFKEGESKIMASSKYVRNCVEVVSKKIKDEEEEDTQLIEELLKYKGTCQDKIILFPTDDYTASVMDASREKLADIFTMPSVENGETLVTCMNKTFQSKIAKSVGMPVAREWLIPLFDEINIPEDMIYPCFCKPVSSITGYKTEMARCDSKEELLEHLKFLKERFSDRNILVQEFLEIDEELDLSGVCLDQQIIIPAATRRTRVGHYDRGVGMIGTIIPAEDLGDTKEKAMELLRNLRYTGMFHMDINKVGDKFYFSEINMRSGGSNYAYYESGVNLPDIFVKHILGENITPEETLVDEYGKIFVYEKVAWGEYLHGYISRDELDNILASGDIHFLFSEDDKEPEIIFTEKMERKAQYKELKENCIKGAMEAAGWSYEQAIDEIKDTKERLNITYKDYDKYKFALIPAEEQEHAYNDILMRRERIKEQKEKCIIMIMEQTGCNQEAALLKIKDARNRLGISYNDYIKTEMINIPEEEQEAVYNKYIERKQRNKRIKEECIVDAMNCAGWDRETAEKEIKDARDRLGVTYKDYKEFGLALVPIKKQEKKYKKLMEKKKKSK